MGHLWTPETASAGKIIIDGENYYLVVGKNFVHATTPHENRPENEKLRRIVDAICHEVTEAQGGGEEDEHIQA